MRANVTCFSEFRKERFNPLRRIWQAPGEALERALRPALGLKNAFLTKTMLFKVRLKTLMLDYVIQG